jgi:hypothetical protein
MLLLEKQSPDREVAPPTQRSVHSGASMMIRKFIIT